MERTISGLTLFAACYGVFYLLEPLWRRGRLPEWTRVPRGVVAWVGIAGLLGPAIGLGDTVVELMTRPTMGTGYTFGFYAFIVALVGWVYSNHEAINFDRVKPLLLESLTFRRRVDEREVLFARAEQAEINAIHREQSGQDVRFAPEKTRRAAQPANDALAELNALRRQRQEEQGKEEIERLNAGASAEITDVLRLFTMHRPAHPRLEQTFYLGIDAGTRLCELRTVFPGLRSAQLADPDRQFRFRQELIDVLQVLTGEPWMARFRPYFDTVMMECHEEVRDSFDLPTKQPFLRLTIASEQLDRYKGRILIATELDKIGVLEWLTGEHP